jgi:chromosome segregation ATPase
MRSISKSQQRDIYTAIDACKEAAEALEKAIDEFNAAVAPFREKLEAARDHYNEKVTDLRSVYGDIAGEARSYYSERSERWQESEAGQAYSEWVDRLDEIELEEIELEVPEELEPPDAIPDFTDDSWLPPEAPGEF